MSLKLRSVKLLLRWPKASLMDKIYIFLRSSLHQILFDKFQILEDFYSRVIEFKTDLNCKAKFCSLIAFVKTFKTFNIKSFAFVN